LTGRLPPTFLLVVVAGAAGLTLRAGLAGADGCQFCFTSELTNTVPPPPFTGKITNLIINKFEHCEENYVYRQK
jgi:hypothetical protein